MAAWLLGVDAVGDELGQPPVGAEHAERAVSGADQLAGRLHDALQGAAQVEVGADADHRVQQRPQPLPAGHHLADPVEQLLQQLVQLHPGQRGQPERRRAPGHFSRRILSRHARNPSDRARAVLRPLVRADRLIERGQHEMVF